VSETLSTVTKLTDESEKALDPLLPPHGKEYLHAYLKKIRTEYRTFIAIGRSIVSLSMVVNENYLKMQSMHKSEVQLIAKLKTPAENISQTN
jgi:hypothetical protein